MCNIGKYVPFVSVEILGENVIPSVPLNMCNWEMYIESMWTDSDIGLSWNQCRNNFGASKWTDMSGDCKSLVIWK